MTIKRFEDVIAWQHARQLAGLAYDAVDGSRLKQDFGLKDQMTRAAGSSMHNIAEGFDSESNAEFIRFLRYASRSASEVQSQLYLALDREYLSRDQFQQIYDKAAETRKTIRGLIKYLASSSQN